MKFEREILRIHSDKESVEKIITFIKAYEEKINKQLDDFTSNDLEEMLKGSSIHTVVRVENFIKTYFDMYESFLNKRGLEKVNNDIEDIIKGIENQKEKDSSKILIELVKWLENEKCVIEEKESEKERVWKSSRNIIIDKTIAKIVELTFK
ncbi:hypothetical protein [Clostridium sp. 1001283B150210_160208_E6]|uniref:hypothetical protein n=1 Tax=Clostridium sp. 1001283B150210_160208_E6 TaxID=2787129 RepID=UPI0018A9F137|nr:hypothetical protein [Clostridium sp. 1001283B150210_160208_E6]